MYADKKTWKNGVTRSLIPWTYPLSGCWIAQTYRIRSRAYNKPNSQKDMTLWVASNWYRGRCGLVLGTSIRIWCHTAWSRPPSLWNAVLTPCWYSLRLEANISTREDASHGRYPSRICHTIGRNSSGIPFQASFFRDAIGTTGICSRVLNFCIRVDCAAASDSDVVGEGVGGRRESNDIEGSMSTL